MRHAKGEDQLETGDLVCLPEGPAGGHRLLNESASVVRVLVLSTTDLPANVHYPDKGHRLIRNQLGNDDVVLRETALGGDTASSQRGADAEPTVT